MRFIKFDYVEDGFYYHVIDIKDIAHAERTTSEDGDVIIVTLRNGERFEFPPTDKNDSLALSLLNL